jgi:carbon monoxide dehydrogenase subunit G
VGITLQNDFTVPAPVDDVWNYFNDPEKVAPCLPGAELTQVVDQNNFKGRVKIKMGPVSLSFAGTLQVVSRNAANHTVVMKGVGGEEKGKGQAEANVTAQLTGSGNSTTVKINQDITMSGAVAQYGRGMMGDVTTVLMNQFAKCLSQSIKSGGPAGKPKAASGFGIAAQSTAVGMKRLFGGGKK